MQQNLEKKQMNELKMRQVEDPYSGAGRNKLVMRDGRVFDIGNIVNTVSIYVEESTKSPGFGESSPATQPLHTRQLSEIKQVGTPAETLNLNFEDSTEDAHLRNDITMADNEPSYFITQK